LKHLISETLLLIEDYKEKLEREIFNRTDEYFNSYKLRDGGKLFDRVKVNLLWEEI